MLPEPLADLDNLDLSRVIVPHEEVYGLLKQRGTFAVIDGVLHHNIEGRLIIGFKDIRAGQPWGDDHIPGRPIFPGTLMVEASAQLGTYDYYQRYPEAREGFVGFTAIRDTRFRAMVEPDCRLLFVARAKRMRKAIFTYCVQGFVERDLVFESEVTGMVL